MPRCLACGAVSEEGALFCGQCGRELGEPGSGWGARPDPWLGRIVDRRYRVIAELGRGGMGMVYKVEHVHLGKNAAMKVLLPSLAEDAETVRRFRIEAQAVSRLNHPNIVQTFDFGLWEGALYLVMEYVEGQDLATISAIEGPLPYRRVLPMFIQVCSALREAHELGVIHRDVKPENLMIVRRRDDSEYVKVLDFGLAKLREPAGTAETAPGNQVIGTPDYMSPEQIRAEPLDPRADIYGLGASLYRVLTGEAPFTGGNPISVLTKHLLEPLEPMRHRRPDLHIPRSIESIVERAMAKNREARYRDVSELERALTLALGNESTLEEIHAHHHEAAPRAASLLESPASSSSRARVLTRAAPGSPNVRPIAITAATTAVIGPSSTLGDRLRRSEFDAFERSLRRRRWLRSVGAPVALLALASGAFWQWSRVQGRTPGEEREPNDTAAEATEMRLDAPIAGFVGGLLDGHSPDLDYFHVSIGTGARALSARLEGIDGVDLVLELFDAAGTQIAKSDSRGVGGAEWIQPTVIGSADAYLLVRQIWIQGTPLLENVAAAYHLTAHANDLEASWEREPDDLPEQATHAEVGVVMNGYLGSPEDHDWFELEPARDGVLSAHVTGGGGGTIVIEPEVDSGRVRGDQERGTPASATEPAAEVRARVSAGQPFRLMVRRKLVVPADPKAAANTVGLDAPYRLETTLTPAR